MATQEIKVPDLGNVDNIDVIEVLVHPGDKVELEQTLAVLETDKATMDLPASAAGEVAQVHIKVGDKVGEGTLVVTLNSDEANSTPEPETKTETTTEAPVSQPSEAPAAAEAVETAPEPQPATDRPPLTPMSNAAHKIHATPSVRLFARELGIDIHQIPEGSGRKGRILKDDVKKFVKSLLQSGSAQTGAGIPSIPAIDFSQFGEVEEQPLSKIKKLTGQNMTRVWLNLPMVTYHDDVDITDLEAFRKATNADKNNDIRLTALVFIMKALVAAMKQFPAFNSSLSVDGESLIFKHYFHIGIAVDTPNGLVVPVIRDVDQKGIFQLSEELSEKSALARKGRLLPQDMQGGCMTISSLGGIGGTAFTPIVNAPEVAILGVTRAKMQPVWDGEQFIPRLMLPLDLTYDHRVIDGAEGARFMEAVKSYLGDIRRLIL